MTTQPIISAIAAMDENYVIGYKNQLPWYLPADLQHFKNITSGHPVLMGRKTFESIGKPLPNRTNIIMTRDASFRAEGCITVTSIQQALAVASKENKKEIFVIGGAQIYAQLLPYIQRIYLTVIHDQFEGDTFFPELVDGEWEEIENTPHMPDGDNAFAYSFITLERRK